MKTKNCYGCKQDLPATSDFFARNKTKPDGLSHKCLGCHRIYNKTWYANNANSVGTRTKQNRANNVATYHIIKSKLKCVACGEDDSACIDFHHIDPNAKEFHVSEAVRYSVGKFLTEAAKCIVLCSNCHRKHHAGRLDLDGFPVGLGDLGDCGVENATNH